jgi:hypothetical protein
MCYSGSISELAIFWVFTDELRAWGSNAFQLSGHTHFVNSTSILGCARHSNTFASVYIPLLTNRALLLFWDTGHFGAGEITILARALVAIVGSSVLSRPLRIDSFTTSQSTFLALTLVGDFNITSSTLVAISLSVNTTNWIILHGTHLDTFAFMVNLNITSVAFVAVRLSVDTTDRGIFIVACFGAFAFIVNLDIASHTLVAVRLSINATDWGILLSADDRINTVKLDTRLSDTHSPDCMTTFVGWTRIHSFTRYSNAFLRVAIVLFSVLAFRFFRFDTVKVDTRLGKAHSSHWLTRFILWAGVFSFARCSNALS